eukprot:TRINITY_DN7249_c0_g2_i3.p1 TRINITY_DN7249_c0_g2~~TRINITY_DN7249_c0_g2_i3.p1  ORF type:complete len:1202 (-),score=270.06 TRINITY_DN7249_c0_g2_i3:108-3713(-)
MAIRSCVGAQASRAAPGTSNSAAAAARELGRLHTPLPTVLHIGQGSAQSAHAFDTSTMAAAAAAMTAVAAGRLGYARRRLRGRACKLTLLRRADGTENASSSVPSSVVSGSMPGRYDYSAIEEDLYNWWESSGFFRPEIAEQVPQSHAGERASYVIPMPPPNVTGRLHMGHAMFASLEDVLARFHRMRGDRTLWLPGTDHAGIATQMLVERQLISEGTTREGVGREEFLRRVWEWKAEKGGAIVEQLRRLGASADWSREQFTLNEHMSAAVVEAFCRLHKMGAIFRGQRMVNWSPVLQTAVSDLEVEYADVSGHLYHFKYVVAGEDGEPEDEYIPVATTRPETILGDSAVCVHPEDPRYQHLIGRKVIVPVQGRAIPVIADAYVDREFGTGALKITPAHDFNDFEIAQRHDLPFHSVISLDGSISPSVEPLGSPQYVGQDRAECRKKLWADLEASGLALKVEDHMQRVPLSQRSGEVIEPMLSDQWFVNTEVMAQRALDAVSSGEIRIQPDRFTKTWEGWLKEKQPWCISRQLWWGHRIPVYYPTNRPGSDKYFVAATEEEALQKARAELGEDVELSQDPDVLDTWFSSGLWPFATVGWPNEASEDFKSFYPATMMETGYDILFFWVARMVMMGLTLTDKVPFTQIYLHGLVRDDKGQKMSKTKGNVVDPLESIAEYGTDALRYALLTNSVPGMDTPVSKGMLENAKAFANKIWNVGRFIITDVEKNAEQTSLAFRSGMQFSEEEVKDMRWLERALISKCHGLCERVSASLSENRFAPPTKELKEFLQDDLASWYVEASKTRLQAHLGGDPASKEAATSQRVLLYLLEVSLKLLHPFMPFVTEAVWQRLPKGVSSPESLMISPWPQPLATRDQAAEKWFTKLCAVTSAVRNARAEQGIPPKERIGLTFWCGDATFQEALESERLAVAWLARAESDQIQALPMSERPAETPPNCIRVVVSEDLEVDMPVPEKEIDVEKEVQRLAKQLDQVSKLLESTEKKISPQFLERANPVARDKILAKRDELRQQKASISTQLSDLQADASEAPSRRDVVAAAFAGLLFSRSEAAQAAVGEGDTLPQGARQEDRIRKGLEAWKKLPEKLKAPEDADKEWENAQGFLRRLYGLNDDMTYLTRGLRGEKKKEAETLIATFKKQVKASDKPAKAKDIDAFMKFHVEITGYLERFGDFLLDATEDIESGEIVDI